jgi:Uma2 family endonuclease
MAVTFRPLSPPTDEEMLALHALNPGYRVERLADGRLLVSPTGARGGARNAELTGQLYVWCRKIRLGKVFDSSTGFVLPNGALYAPDGAYVSEARWSALTWAESERYFAGAPDAAFEIISRTDDRPETEAKCESFARHGSALVVLIDPYAPNVDVWRNGARTELGTIDQFDCAPVMPDFLLDVEAIRSA